MAKELDKFEDEEMNIFDEKVKEKEDSSSNKTLAYGMDERETIFLYSEIDNAWTISTNVRKHITKLMKSFVKKKMKKQVELFQLKSWLMI